MAIRDGTPEAHGADDPGSPEGLAPHLGGVAPGQVVAVALPRPEGDSQDAPIVARNVVRRARSGGAATAERR
ncbi:hypothetical protein J8N05_36380 [Streptomyces sp. BH-SS-21]|uniref:Uncharacterized protein n=1 Tax=Streptomyces liliiviolaceus TaxID=2823109 RepID=A0A940Y5P3_9ACTN|nr:hypothetical protein [Streptomyces liliiviolaceus]MBQ0853642.1 hypothetical protein [Streptomyces liliiviolaceus]